MRKFKLKSFTNKLKFGVRLQSILDMIMTRTRRIYLGHPSMWKFGNIYDSIALLDLAKKKMVEEDYTNNPLVRSIRDFREEKRIAKKYKLAKLTIHGYEMIKGLKMNFPDSEFEERYAARNLDATRRISSWKKRVAYKN